MITTLLVVLLVAAAFALLYWGFNQLSLPPMVKVIITVVFGLIALMFIYNLVVGGNLSLR